MVKLLKGCVWLQSYKNGQVWGKLKIRSNVRNGYDLSLGFQLVLGCYSQVKYLGSIIDQSQPMFLGSRIWRKFQDNFHHSVDNHFYDQNVNKPGRM